MNRARLAGLALIAAAALALTVKTGELDWWVINLAGGAAFLLLGLSAAVSPAGLRLGLHARLGRWALGLAALHAAASLIADPTVWRYAALSIPGEILAGVLALLVLAAAVLVREPGLMHRLPALGRWPHRLLAILAALLSLAHIVFVPGLAWWIIAALALGAALVFARMPRSRLRTLLWPTAVLGVVAALLGLFLFAGPFVEARMSELRQAPVDERMFDHATHTTVTCLACHHNFADRSGFENCLACHKAVSFDESTRIDRTFHALCTGCHAERRLAGEAHGPTDSCLACHAKHTASTFPSN